MLARNQVVAHGHKFCWNDVFNTAYMFEASMRLCQQGQHKLQKAQTMLGTQAFKTNVKAAQCFACVMTDVFPKWTFKPFTLPDVVFEDVYGHYCLARAFAYHAVGEADLKATNKAQIVSAANAAHLFAVASHLLTGDVSTIIEHAQYNVGKLLQLRANEYLTMWEQDKDDMGAAKACACLDEASVRYAAAKRGDCTKERNYAYARNHVHWQEPKLPDWSALFKVQITPLTSLLT